jgi:hypothetical protein
MVPPCLASPESEAVVSEPLVVSAGVAELDVDVSEPLSLPQAANTSAETATSIRAARALRNFIN